MRRRFAVPCVARLVRRLRNSRYALRQSSQKSPDQPALLGGAQGKASQVGWARFCAHAGSCSNSLEQKPPGVARQQVTFFCFAKKKVTKEKATPVRRCFAVPCVARLVRRLRNSRYALRQSSPKSPDQSALLGGAQGKASQKRYAGFVCALRTLYFRWARRACPPRGGGALDFGFCFSLSPERRLDQARMSGGVRRALFEHVAA